MAKDNGADASLHWFAFYPGDFGRDTQHLDAEEIGAYILLLMHQWTKGSIPDDVERLVRITKACERITVDIVAEFFPEGANLRMEKERARALGKSEKARESALKRWHPDQEPPEEPVRTDMRTHSERNAKAMLPQPQPPLQLETQIQPEPEPAIPAIQGLVSDAMWETFKSTYPARQGNQYWAKGRAKANKLLNAGVEWSEIMAGARRYREQSEATGKVGTEMIKQAQFWLTPEEQLWTEEYPIQQLGERTSRTVSNLSKLV